LRQPVGGVVADAVGASEFANSTLLSMMFHAAILCGFVAVRFAHHNLCGLQTGFGNCFMRLFFTITTLVFVVKMHRPYK
jgi:hypothetical protein